MEGKYILTIDRLEENGLFSSFSVDNKGSLLTNLIWGIAIYAATRLGIPIFGSNFWDPHRRRNSIFFEIPISGESENRNSDLKFLEFRQFLAQELSTSFCR